MYQNIKTVLSGKAYNLQDMLTKIKLFWLAGDLTREQYLELINLANENATVDGQRAGMEQQISAIFENLEELSERIQMLEIAVDELKKSVGSTDDPTDPEQGGTDEPAPEPEEIIDEWSAWSGVGTIKWQNGTKCTHNGKTWESQVDNNIWEPGAPGVYENIWKEIIAE
jgi:hypothetical protein